MTNKTDIKENSDDIREIRKEFVLLEKRMTDNETNFKLMNKDLSTIQKLVYGMVSIILTAVVIAITSSVIK
jgi:hypothetical protein